MYIEEINVCEAYPFFFFFLLFTSVGEQEECHTEERACQRCNGNWEKEKKVFEDDVFIENTCLGIGNSKLRTKFTRT